MCHGTAGLRIVPVSTDGDLATWLEVYNRASPCRPEGPAQLRHYWELAPAWCSVIAWRGDRPVGVGHVEVQHWVPGSRIADAEVVVSKPERRTGVGTAVYRDLSAWARDRDLIGLEVWVDEAELDGPVFWAARGYREVGRERVSYVDLKGGEPPAVPVPEGVELVALAGRENLEPGMYRVGVEGIADIPGADAYDAGDFEHWRRSVLCIPGTLPECSVVALAGAEVVGFATIVRYEARPDIGEHEMTAVARAWRGRGIAQAMKARTIVLARDAGLAALESMNEARNASILAVNTRLGYVPATEIAQLQGPLAPTA
jgi:GNAT superfamily N-acetyltransferase